MDKIEKICSGIVAAAFLACATITGYSISDECRYRKEHRFSATATVKEDRLRLSSWTGNVYTVLTQKNKILRHSDKNIEYLQGLEMALEKGTEIKYTGYPDRTYPNRTIVEKIELPTEKICE